MPWLPPPKFWLPPAPERLAADAPPPPQSMVPALGPLPRSIPPWFARFPSPAPYLSRVPWSRYATPLRWAALWFQLPLLTLFLKFALLLLRTKLLLTLT